MIFVTGDTHTGWMSRLCSDAFPEGRHLTKDDLVIILGDFGIWDNSKREKNDLDWLENKPWTTLFVDGNHENFDILDGLPVSEWNGGKVHAVRPSVLHLMRGQVFWIPNGLTIWAFGGASSHDISDGILEPEDPRVKEWKRSWYRQYRINHVSWWERELPSDQEMEEGLENLRKAGNDVDFILTHCPYQALLDRNDPERVLYKPDRLTKYLQQVYQENNFQWWLCGHMHVNRKYNKERTVCLYEQIVPIQNT